jgi:hypothetical protein
MSRYNSFEQIDESEIKKLVSEYNVIDGENFLKTLLESIFPYGYSRIPDEIILYKILYLKSENDFDKQRLNTHYFANREDVENIKGILDGAGYNGEPYLLTVKTKKGNIDIEQTIRQNLLYQFEYETTLKLNSKIEKISLENL